MSKKINKWDAKHLNNLTAIQRQVERIFEAAVREAARIGVKIDKISPDRLFSFSDYPSTQKEVKKLIDGLKSGLMAIIVNGIRSAWTLSNNKNNELARQVFGDNVGKLSQAQYRRYFSTNGEALDAFLNRKESGLSLSDRVWRYTNAFKNEIELGLDVGIRNGLSADEMSAELRQWLRHPDMLFRRIRDEHGNLKLSQRAEAFHPGRGVYRSSYKNARRLAATETNIAYRTADYERWQQFDFVVGIRVVLSNNHTLLGADGKPHPFTDICDELSAPLGSQNTQGRGCYPKDFKFTGWHPHCRCHAESILKTAEEVAEDTKRILEGKAPLVNSVNTVKTVPDELNQWISKNMERMETSYSMPYFVKDNLKYMPKGIDTLWGNKVPYPTYAEYAAAMKFNKLKGGFAPEQVKNHREFSTLLPIIQGKIMNFTQADQMHVNPLWGSDNYKEKGYGYNCQTCVMAYELRRRGFNIEAMANPIYYSKRGIEIREFDRVAAVNRTSWQDRFLELDGSPVQYTKSNGLIRNDTVSAKLNWIEENTKEIGRYEVYCEWKKQSSHVFTIERTKDRKILWYDPQTGRKGDYFEDYLEKMRKDAIWICRIDSKLINTKFASRFLRSVGK